MECSSIAHATDYLISNQASSDTSRPTVGVVLGVGVFKNLHAIIIIS